MTMGQEQKKIFLIDAMGLIYRAYYALNKNPRINSKGKNTSAALGFANSLYEIIRKERPSHIGVAFDSFGPTLRHTDYSAYKANRESTPEDIVACLPDIRQLIAAFRIPLLELPGYEADDIIGTLAKKAEQSGFEVYMVTADKDYGQLVSEHIFMYKLAHAGGGASILGVPEICEKYGISHPDQLIDLLGLWGDASDNIPGIKGVGEVTARKLISQFGSIENMLENAAQIANPKLQQKIVDGREDALVSKQLATIMLDVPLTWDETSFRMQTPDFTLLRPVMEELEFRTLLKRIQSDYAAVEPREASGMLELFPSEAADEAASPNLHNTPHTYVEVRDFPSLLEMGVALSASPDVAFAVQAETSGSLVAEVKAVAFCTEEGKAFYVPLPAEAEEARMWLTALQPLFASEEVRKITYDLKLSLQALALYGVRIEAPCFDVLLAHYVLEPEQRHRLDALSYQYLSYDMLPSASGAAPATDALCEQADTALRLYRRFSPLMEEREVNALFEHIEMPLVPVLSAMERRGVRVDVAYLKTYSAVLQERISALENEIHQLAGEPFNIASPKQLGVILFEKLHVIENAKLTKTKQYQTGEEVLQKLLHKHPIVQKVLDYRGLQKLKSTYTDAFQQLVNPLTGRVHTSFNQAITATGRLSSSNPNLQNIPVRNDEGREIRKAFVPADGEHVLLAADYSQIELRIMASLSGDEGMIQAFREGSDIHTATAAKIYNVPMDEVSKEMRRHAKTVNFGIIYGMSAFGLSERLGIARKEAADIITQYFEKYPGIRRYMESQKAFALEHGYVETLCHRRRYLPDIRSHNAVVRGVAERNAINAPVQGSAADMIKLAMIRVYRELERQGLQSSIVLQVHDELVLDVYRPELEAVGEIVEKAMLEALPLSVPLEVDMRYGNNWLEAH